MKKIFLPLVLISVAVLAGAVYAFLLRPYGAAQDGEGAGKSWLLTYIENRISTPGRQVRISNIDSLRSSHAVIRSITVADRDGVWLKADNITLDWHRLALLRGSVSIDSLFAERVDIFRKPLPDESAAAAKTTAWTGDNRFFRLPEPPVNILARKIRVKQIVLGRSLLGGEATFGLDGSGTWTGRMLEAALNLPRLDGAGGGASLNISRQAQEDGLTFSLDVNAPANGLVARASGKIAADGFPLRLNAALSLQDKAGQAAVIPFSDGRQTVQTAVLHIAYGADGKKTWNGNIAVKGLKGSSISWDNAHFTFTGPAEDLDNPVKRHVGLIVKGTVSNLAAPWLKSSAPLQTAQLDADMDWRAGAPLVIRRAQIRADGQVLDITGQVEDRVFQGDVKFRVADLKPFSGLAGRPLAGRADISARGKAGLADGTFDVALDGNVAGLATGVAIADRLLQDKTTLGGGLVRDRSGLRARALRVANRRFALNADGHISAESADMTFSGGLADMALVDPRTKGAATFAGSARGKNRQIALALRGQVADGLWNGRRLSAAVVTLDGMLDNTPLFARSVRATIEGNGRFDNQPLVLSAVVRRDEKQTTVEKMSAVIGKAVVEGYGKKHGESNILEGNLRFDVPDISTPAALLLMQGKGMAQGEIRLAGNAAVGQNADIKARMQGVDVAGVRVGSLDMQAVVQDAFGVPRVTGTVDAAAVSIRGYAVKTVTAKSVMKGKDSQFNVAAELADNTVFAADGALSADSDAFSSRAQGWQLHLDRAGVQQGMMDVALLRPAKLGVDRKGNIGIDNLALRAGGGTLTVQGTVGDTVKLAIDAQQFPLSAANLLRPGLGAGGVVDARVNIAGPRANPTIDADINGSGVTAGLLQERGIAPLAVQAKGKTGNQTLTLDARATGGGLDAAAKGQVFLKARKLDLDVALKETPLAVLNGFVKGQNFSGIVTGSAHISGAVNDPAINFSVDGKNLGAKALADNGMKPLDLKAAGSYAGHAVKLDNLDLGGVAGGGLKMSGRLPLSGPGLDLKINGSAPLDFASHFLAGRGLQLAGTLTVDATVAGSLAAPRLDGSFSVDGGRLVDPETNLRLNAITIRGRLNGEKVLLEQVSAASANGGTIGLDGSVSTSFAQGLPANLALTLNHASYNDSERLSATLNGKLTITGPLLRGPLIAGEVLVEKAEITVPDNFGGANWIDIHHRRLTPPIAGTLRRAGLMNNEEQHKKEEGDKANGPKLDVLVSAPNRIFIRGRGLDAEMGGRLRLVGQMTQIHPIGSFNLIRGRFDILARQLTFDTGQVTLSGNMNPDLNFVARTEGSDITVTVTVTGTPDNLEVVFSSQPELPQDEVLAQLLFNRSVGELSPFQVAQLAMAAAQFAGITDSSLLGNLRSATGLDDLDVVTDNAGNTAVKAGRYIRENIYLGVEAGPNGMTSGTVNLDINRNLKAKGVVGADDNSNVGIFYEKDY